MESERNRVLHPSKKKGDRTIAKPTEPDPNPRCRTNGCSHLSTDHPGARALVFEAVEPFPAAVCHPSSADTPFV